MSKSERFELFLADNPHIYDLLVRFTRERVETTGSTDFGIREVWERARWEISVKTKSNDFKLNDHFTSFFARLIDYRERDLAGVFELRRSLEADQWIEQLKARERVAS